jgi:putative NIF3 family GTP cyclohydrolase 1 type 2
MRRRDFLYVVGANSVAAVLAGSAPGKEAIEALRRKKDLTVGDLHGYLRSLYEVKEPSCDRIIVGDLAHKISKVGTAWMGSWRTCREAVAVGVDTLVVHEPTFYAHWDEIATDPLVSPHKTARVAYERLAAAKRKWIEEHGLSIIRCHDVLDRVGGFGIPFALGQTLGFANDDVVRSRLFYNVYRIEPAAAREVARRIAQRLAPLGQPGVAFCGDENRRVGTVAVGTGCICNPVEFADIEADLRIAIDDAVHTWVQTAYAEDSGDPLVVINHGTSEEPGMKALAGHLSEAFPRLPCVHLGKGCGYRWIVGGE